MPIGETMITLVGNLTAAPELTYTASGAPRLTFNVASNSRNWDKTRSEWGEGRTLFLRCTAWRWLAENAHASLTKGTRVIVTGALRQFEYTGPDDVQRIGFSVDVEDIAVSLRFATATVQRTSRTAAPADKTPAGARGAGDPWAASRPGGDDEPPF